MDKQQNGTVLNVRWIEIHGHKVLQQLIKFPDGTTEWQLVEDIVKGENPETPFATSFTERFNNTDTVPNTLVARHTNPLFRKPIRTIEDPNNPYMNESKEELLARSARLHATLLRICGGEPSNLKGQKIHVKDKQSTSREMLQLFCAAMGGEWPDIVESIY
jgi:hypothetical protein